MKTGLYGRNAARIIGAVLLGCAVMALTDAVLRPGYFVKSLIKLLAFPGLAWFAFYRQERQRLAALFRPGRSGFLPLAAGTGCYLLIFGTYLLTRGQIDYSGVAGAMQRQLGLNAGNFVFAALYISFINSLLEEFFFRGFAFLTLRDYAPRAALWFSALVFALYHMPMLLGWFAPPVLLLLTAAIFAAGLLFSLLCAHSGNLYFSWCLHMFANFAVNTIGFLLLRN